MNDELVEAFSQALQDHMEQFHGVCLKASEWDKAAKAALSAFPLEELVGALNIARSHIDGRWTSASIRVGVLKKIDAALERVSGSGQGETK